MTDILLLILAVLTGCVIVLQIALLLRRPVADMTGLDQSLGQLSGNVDRVERSIRDEIARNREESAASARQAREELATTLKNVGDSLLQQLVAQSTTSEQKHEQMRQTVEQRLQTIQGEMGKRQDAMRQESLLAAGQVREEVTNSLKTFNESVANRIGDLTALQRTQLGNMQEQITKLTEGNAKSLDQLRLTVEQKLTLLQMDNAQKLEQIRVTVDEKLQGTLEKRLTESFKLVGDHLEQVQRGLGEMQTLASSVGDLKRVMTNVKTRGGWGEVQLETLLAEMLTAAQYARNISTKHGSGDIVEFAIRLPGKAEDPNDVVWLPIDAKFPKEDYERLVDAHDKADLEAIDAAGKALEQRVKLFARDIHTKYIDPPHTTNFGIMFLPTEGLYAEVVRRAGLVDQLQRDYRVVIAGPTTFAALLNSLQMGFRTLAIQKRSGEVWKILGAVKFEFGRFGDLLAGVKKKLDEASGKIDEASSKSRNIAKKLRDVQELPEAEAQTLLAAASPGDNGQAD